MAPFKSSLVKSAGKLFGVFNQQDLSLRGATQTQRTGVAGLQASGGTKSTPGNGYVYHVFTSPATSPAPHSFEITSGTGDVNLLVVGGGGGGGGKYGGSAGGGGGGAGVVHDRLLPDLGPGTYPITVGAGGLGNTYPSSSPGNPGDDTVWNAPGSGTPALTAAGGGAGGGGTNTDHLGQPGGSGGGNAYNDPGGNAASTGSGDTYPGSGSTISPANGWGSNGGTADTSNRDAGGGGGAGANGESAPPVTADGGIGIEIPWVLPTHGETKYFGGGGGAGRYPGGDGPGGTGGTGGGGNGGGTSTVENGTASTGGGAGGMESGGTTQSRGGSGVVIIRYSA